MCCNKCFFWSVSAKRTHQQIHWNQNIDSLYFGLYWILWPVLMKMRLPSLKKQAAKPQLRLTPQIRCLETTIYNPDGCLQNDNTCHWKKSKITNLKITKRT